MMVYSVDLSGSLSTTLAYIHASDVENGFLCSPKWFIE